MYVQDGATAIFAPTTDPSQGRAKVVQETREEFN